MTRIEKDNFTKNIRIKMGIDTNDDKLVFKYDAITEKEDCVIKPSQSEHTFAL